MSTQLQELKISEVSLVDFPANSSVDPVTGKKVRHACVALYKRDSEDDVEFQKAVDGQKQNGSVFPKSDYAYTPSENSSDWKLRLTKTPGGAPDAGIVGAAVAALGKGFRGNKVQIPAEALSGVKTRVRAAWKKANPEKGDDEIPEVIRKGEEMTLTEIEKRVVDQEVVVAKMTADNEILKKENTLVLKMSKKQRALFAAMPEDKQKAYVAGDAEKQKAMMSEAGQEAKCKAAEDGMDEATQKRFRKAGPAERELMVAEINKAACPTCDGDGETVSGADCPDCGGTGQMKKKQKVAAKPPADSEDPNDNEDDMEDEEKKEKAATIALKRDHVRLLDRVTKAETELALITKRSRLEHFTKRAEDDFPNTAGNPVEKGEMLMNLADSLPGGETGESFKKIHATLKAADTAMKVNFTEIGKHGGTIPALKAFEAKAEEISKRDKIDLSHATERAMMENPDLYLAYEHDQRQLVHNH